MNPARGVPDSRSGRRSRSTTGPAIVAMSRPHAVYPTRHSYALRARDETANHSLLTRGTPLHVCCGGWPPSSFPRKRERSFAQNQFGRLLLGSAARLAILHCALLVPNQRNDVTRLSP